METKVQRVEQGDKVRFVTSVPKPLVEIMRLEGKKLQWTYIRERNTVELTVINNGHGRKSGSGT